MSLSINGGALVEIAGARGGFTSVCAVIMLAAALVLIIKSLGFRGAPIFVALLLVCSCTALASYFAEISRLYSFISSYADVEKYVKAVLKIIGVGYVCAISSEVCCELGEATLSKCIHLAARAELVIIALPFVYEILEAALSLLEA